jgi:hypothetical protein
MRVQVVGITDRGIPDRERLHLRALVALNLSNVMVVSTRYGSVATVFPGGLPSYWFPAKIVKPGDNIVLYTNAGMPTEETVPGGVSNHFYHWGFGTPIWSDPAACVVVFDVVDWQASYPPVPTPALGPSPLSTLAANLLPPPGHL